MEVLWVFGIAIVGAAVAAGAVWLGWKAAKAFLCGVIWLWAWFESVFGGIGTIVYLILWIAFFPIMAAICGFVGAIVMSAIASEEREERRVEKFRRRLPVHDS